MTDAKVISFPTAERLQTVAKEEKDRDLHMQQLVRDKLHTWVSRHRVGKAIGWLFDLDEAYHVPVAPFSRTINPSRMAHLGISIANELGLEPAANLAADFYTSHQVITRGLFSGHIPPAAQRNLAFPETLDREVWQGVSCYDLSKAAIFRAAGFLALEVRGEPPVRAVEITMPEQAGLANPLDIDEISHFRAVLMAGHQGRPVQAGQ